MSDNSGGIYLKYFILLSNVNPSVTFTPKSSKNTIPIDHTSLDELNPYVIYSGDIYFSVPKESSAYSTSFFYNFLAIPKSPIKIKKLFLILTKDSVII